MENQNALSFSVIDYLCDVATKLESVGIKSEKMNTVKSKTQDLAQYFGVSEKLTHVIIGIFVLSLKYNFVDVEHIGRFLKLELIEILKLRSEIRELVEKGLIVHEEELFGRRHRQSNIDNYKVNIDVYDSIYANRPIAALNPKTMDIYTFCSEVSDLIEKRVEDVFCTPDLFRNVEIFEKKHKDLSEISTLLNLNLRIEDRIILYEMCDDYVSSNGGRATALIKTLNDIYDKQKARLVRTKMFMDKKHPLIELNLVDVGGANYANDIGVELTSYALEIFLGEDVELFNARKGKIKGVIEAGAIVSKELFFDGKLKEEVDFISEILQQDQYEAVTSKLAENGLPESINILFHGYPGTGKTELCYQLSKKTGRNIMQVDLSQTRNMFFGESEKKVKEIFYVYRRLCKRCEITPILLINEADGLLSKRHDNPARSIEQTENTIQNILLEEMERFQGIMLCTSNLVKNLDSAFERRFLFKVKFEKPGVEIKKDIWQNKLPWLNETTSVYLAQKYSFSGGEIENIVRKTVTYEILRGDKPNEKMIYSFCDAEKLETASRKKVGFS